MQVDISKRLRALRLERGMYQKELVEEIEKVLGRNYKIKHSVRRIQDMEAGRRSPTMSELLALSAIFQVSIKYLVGETDNRK